MPTVLTYATTKGSFFDLGAQLSDQEAEGPACSYAVPPDIYVDGYGGIDRVRWTMNPWSGAKPGETSSGCQAGRCLKITGMGSGAGFHIYYMHAFPPTTFKTLRVALRVEKGTGAVGITLNGGGGGCQETKVELTSEWKEITLDLATVCAGVSDVSMFTVLGQDPLTLFLDNLGFGN